MFILSLFVCLFVSLDDAAVLAVLRPSLRLPQQQPSVSFLAVLEWEVLKKEWKESA